MTGCDMPIETSGDLTFVPSAVGWEPRAVVNGLGETRYGLWRSDRLPGHEWYEKPRFLGGGRYLVGWYRRLWRSRRRAQRFADDLNREDAASTWTPR